jgi:hypothetical protein
MDLHPVGWVPVVALVVSCTQGTDGPAEPAPTSTSVSASPSESPPRPETTLTAAPRPVGPGAFDVDRAVAVMRLLAGRIGPRHGTSPEFRRAADWVATELESFGYRVSEPGFAVPGGVSWGVPVAAGRSRNVVATPPGFDPDRPHVVVGAHLDTVPQAPGAEDNASGVGVLLAAARAASDRETRLPVVWVAFGAEEPRGETDDDHHFGSRAYVAAMTGAERRALRGMVSLDRVGVGTAVPVGSAGERDPVQRQLLAAARRAEVRAYADTLSRSSDHWSFVRTGLPGARLGGTSYAAYHSPADLPGVVEPAQLERTGRIVLAWLTPTDR